MQAARMHDDERQPAQPNPDGYFPIDLAAFSHATRDLDVYCKHSSCDQPVLYCAEGAALSAQDRDRLLSRGVRNVYAPLEQHHRFTAALLQGLDQAVRDGACGPKRLHQSCEPILEEALRTATTISLRSVTALADRLALWAMETPEALGRLLQLGPREHRLDGHMLRTGLGCALLAARLRPGDEDLLHDAAQAGLMHDLGMRQIDDHLLQKQGQLALAEWHRVEQHPVRGAALLEHCSQVRPGAVEAVRDHHERLDGHGYPGERPGRTLSPATRLCAIVDTFDTIAAARPYRRAIHPLDALGAMRDGVGAHFDSVAFEAFCALVREQLERDPGRADPLTPCDTKEGRPSITRILHSPPGGMPPYIPDGGNAMNQYWDSERRTNDRTPVRLRVKGRVIRLGKPGQAEPGDEVDLVTVDLSPGGVQLLSPWALSRGDVLLLTIPGAEGKSITRHARVVRVRSRSDGAWSAGMEFIQPLEAEDAPQRAEAPAQSDRPAA